MHRSQLKLAIAISCIFIVCGTSADVRAQFQGRRIDDGQQYWNNYWQHQHGHIAPTVPRSRAATIGNTGGYYSTYQPAQKPFAGSQPAPTAYQRYWPLMVYPNTGLGYWY